jgi:pimeloyl-ACP methyl ester carboxylesterase
MVQNLQEPFAEYIPNKKVPLGLIGHSMGGGLCFYVASMFPSINYVFCMAPAPGEKAFAPHDAIDKHAPRNSMLLAGKWDLIAKREIVKELSALCNSKKSRSSIYVDIDRGLHTGFEDELVIFNIDSAALGSVLGIFESLIVKAFFFFRTRTGQLEITRTLLSYFCSRMVKGERMTIEQAMDILETDPDMSEKWTDKAAVTYGSSE